MSPKSHALSRLEIFLADHREQLVLQLVNSHDMLEMNLAKGGITVIQEIFNRIDEYKKEGEEYLNG